MKISEVLLEVAFWIPNIPFRPNWGDLYEDWSIKVNYMQQIVALLS